ncbi:hypothetical protein FRB97_005646 [Tulasnella sp. 331]|nr:hypothetical protein FRB97_005646 [Tulasnella sp. 331]
MVPLALLVVLFISVAYKASSFLFSSGTPLKVYFQQKMDLDEGSLGQNNIVTLFGVKEYLRDYIFPSIPSVWDVMTRGDGSPRYGGVEERRLRLAACSYKGSRPEVALEVNRDATITSTSRKRNSPKELLAFTV